MIMGMVLGKFTAKKMTQYKRCGITITMIIFLTDLIITETQKFL